MWIANVPTSTKVGGKISVLFILLLQFIVLDLFVIAFYFGQFYARFFSFMYLFVCTSFFQYMYASSTVPSAISCARPLCWIILSFPFFIVLHIVLFQIYNLVLLLHWSTQLINLHQSSVTLHFRMILLAVSQLYQQSMFHIHVKQHSTHTYAFKTHFLLISTLPSLGQMLCLFVLSCSLHFVCCNCPFLSNSLP